MLLTFLGGKVIMKEQIVIAQPNTLTAKARDEQSKTYSKPCETSKMS